VIAIETKIDNALAYVLHLARHIPRGNVSAATLALLIEMGFKTNVDGFCYLRHAILMKTEHPELRFMDIYMDVGKRYGAGASYKQVERTLRYAIESTYKRRKTEVWDYFFWEIHIGEKGCPSDSVFISQMACVMELWRGCCKEAGCDG